MAAAAALVALAGTPGALAQQGWLARLMGVRSVHELGASDAATRAAAARRLGVWGAPEAAVEALVEQMRHEEDASVRIAIVEALARRAHPATIALLAAEVESVSAGEYARRKAALALASIGTQTAARRLVQLLGVPHAEEAAVDALVRLDAVAVPWLERALSDPERARGAAAALGRIGDPTTVGALSALAVRAPPSVAVAALDALGRLADAEGRHAVLARLDDPSDEVARAALEALARVGVREDAQRVLRVLRQRPVLLESAWVALASVAPDRAAAWIAREVPPMLRPRLVALRDPSFVAPLAALLDEPEHGPAAALALAEIGTPDALAALGRSSSRHALIARSVAARLGGERPTGFDVMGLAPATGLLLAATARLGDAAERAVAALGSSNATMRAAAARALTLAPDPDACGPLGRAFTIERDAEVLRRLADALAACRCEGDVPIGIWLDRIRSDATAPEAVLAVSALHAAAEGRNRRRLIEAFRAALRADHPRVRAAAALAHGRLRDASGVGTLLHALAEEPEPAVRLAIARALEVLGPHADAIRDRLRRAARMEADDAVADLLDRAAGLARRRLAAMGDAGDRTMTIRVRRASDGAVMPLVEVLLPDGRWLRLAPDEDGWLWLVDLPSGSVHVRLVAPEHASAP
ncbi:MAG: HEAT repeat domain-containing protein [Myxococcota bacterium]|nr:HEAT repeat domain-containing protein [Myxococcota bacterium]